MWYGRRWIMLVLSCLGAFCVGPSCQKQPLPEQSNTTEAQVIDDDDDYETLPTPATTTTATPAPGPTPTLEPTPPPPSPTLGPPPPPNVSGTIYAGTTSPSEDIAIRLAFYNSMQLTAGDTPKDPDDFVFQLTFFPPVTLPISFIANVPTGDDYIAEAWQDTNQNNTIDAGDLVGDSVRFFATEQETTLEITLGVRN